MHGSLGDCEASLIKGSCRRKTVAFSREHFHLKIHKIEERSCACFIERFVFVNVTLLLLLSPEVGDF